jgi:hypothetical protein
VSTPTPLTLFEERLLEQLKHVVAETGPRVAPTRARARQRHRTAISLALVALPIAVAVAAVSFLGNSRPGIAQAAVISRATTALEQPNTILYLKVIEHNSGGICIGEAGCTPIDPTTAKNGISPEPAEDTVTNTYQQWLSPDGSQQRTVEGDGQELVSNAATNEQITYDPANGRLTTITDAGVPSPSISGPAASPTISYLKSLYQEARAGRQNLQLVGQTTIGEKSVYELRLSSSALPQADAPGNMCGSAICKPPTVSVLIYLDSETFVPVRTVITNPKIEPGHVGVLVRDVTDFVAESLPDTAANESLLQMPSHPDATVRRTQAQPSAEPKNVQQRSIHLP